VQQQPQAPQQNASRWQRDLGAENACQRIHSSPASTSRDALGMYGQLSAPLRAPLLAPPPAFQLTSLVAAAAGSSNSEPLPQLPPQRSNSAALSSSTASSLSTGQVPAGLPVASGPVDTAGTSPAAPPSPKAAQLLVVSPALPAGMQRTQWSLSDFWISQRLYRGYASSVYHVSE
jgi:hypothetical protein